MATEVPTFDLSLVMNRTAKHAQWDVETAQVAEVEYRRFMAICKQTDEDATR